MELQKKQLVTFSLAKLFESFGGASEATMRAYLEILINYDESRIKEAVRVLMINWKSSYNSKYPSIAEIIECMPRVQQKQLMIEDEKSPVTSKEQAKKNIARMREMLRKNPIG